MGGSFIHAVLLASVKYIAEGFTLEKAIKTVSCPTVECIDVLSIVSIYGCASHVLRFKNLCSLKNAYIISCRRSLSFRRVRRSTMY